ncbi:flagellar biosynthesis anti-sigma factor FlgM [Shewanella gaetbuli]|uniref:Negative regulator of flagellin synthesis n=1 Tax=Shewanella gaetbuli TaxID=220752 RepID=A0A9X1ZG24_9GAMM|nr:flagellar biosynthesis anti-sigma factor FlgM [Shewanella gaetbuli]MCL1141714.1 flagellar biosynthesis anti-sigma factor FlgM [Shewanella gaetbuli]
MAIDINKLRTATPSPVNTSRDAKGSSAAATSSTTNTTAKSDSVSITSQAQELQSAQAKIANLPEVNQQKVDEIKQAIAEGRYKVDPEKLAANIASFEAELGELKLQDE